MQNLTDYEIEELVKFAHHMYEEYVISPAEYVDTRWQEHLRKDVISFVEIMDIPNINLFYTSDVLIDMDKNKLYGIGMWTNFLIKNLDRTGRLEFIDRLERELQSLKEEVKRRRLYK